MKKIIMNKTQNTPYNVPLSCIDIICDVLPNILT